MISSMLKPVVDGIGATAECCWDDLTLSCKRYSEMLCLCWDNAEISSDDNNDAEFCWVELRWWWYLLLRTLFILVLPNSGDKNGNFELSSPMVVTSTSASLSSLDSVRWDPVAFQCQGLWWWCQSPGILDTSWKAAVCTSSLLEKNWDRLFPPVPPLWFPPPMFGIGGGCGTVTESQMLCVNLCRLRSQLRLKTFLHWLHS